MTATSLDPDDWSELRLQGHRMLDDMFDHLQSLRDRPVWSPPPAQARERFREPLPQGPSGLADVHAGFLRDILPYGGGNLHPGFMGWVQGGGSPVGMLAEMLAAGLNANLGGRDHMPVEVERQVLEWTRGMFGFPAGASGLFVTGASTANFIGVCIARTRALGVQARRTGLPDGHGLVAYAARTAHGCVARAMEMAGIGSDRLRLIGVDALHRIRLDELEAAIAADRAAGLRPFLLVGSAGTVDVGAIDDLHGLADIALREDIAFHVDGALGALGVLSPQVAPRLAGIERADTLALDFHKWGQAPYDAGFLLARDEALHRATFAAEAAYLSRADRGLAAGERWPCDYGPDLSRGFRALKVWFTLKTYGAAALGDAIARTCDLAEALGRRVEACQDLELLAPVQLNIVCFRHRGGDPDRLNAGMVADLQEAGRVAPSLTRIDGRAAMRAAIVNHRTDERDLDALVASVLELGRKAHPRAA